jgi:hypothetical protein
MNRILSFLGFLLRLPVSIMCYLYIAIRAKRMGISTQEYYEMVAKEINKLQNEE